jgi:hypothetical protein
MLAPRVSIGCGHAPNRSKCVSGTFVCDVAMCVDANRVPTCLAVSVRPIHTERVDRATTYRVLSLSPQP